MLRRTARRRQDVARTVDRAGDGPQVRAPLGRRRARRSRDPRTSPHLHRCDAGHDRARAARCRDEQSGHDDRRDRQGRRATSAAIRSRRCSKCSIRSRTTRSAITTSTCRSICRTCCSSARPTASTTISPPLRDRMEIIPLSGYTELEKLQIAKRYLVKKQRKANGLEGNPGADHRSGDARDHQRLHARGRRPQSRTRDRHGLPQGRAQDRRGSAVQGARQAREHRRLLCRSRASSTK